MEIEQLRQQKLTIERQIEDITTAEVKANIEKYEANYYELLRKHTDAKETRKINDVAIQKLIAEKYAEIEELRKVYLEDTSVINRIAKEMTENGEALAEQKQVLADLLSKV